VANAAAGDGSRLRRRSLAAEPNQRLDRRRASTKSVPLAEDDALSPEAH